MPFLYSDPTRANDPHALPNIEVFEVEDAQAAADRQHLSTVPPEWAKYPAGWYWWPCFPGCLPDGDPVGPFDTADEAIADAQEDA